MTDSPEWRYEPVFPPRVVDGDMTKQDLEAHARFYMDAHDAEVDALYRSCEMGEISVLVRQEETRLENAKLLNILRSLLNDYLYGTNAPYVVVGGDDSQ